MCQMLLGCSERGGRQSQLVFQLPLLQNEQIKQLQLLSGIRGSVKGDEMESGDGIGVV